MVNRYPVARTEIEPRVFIRATDDYLQLAARFVVPVRLARWCNDELTRRVLARFEQAGIEVASETTDVTLRYGNRRRVSTSSALRPGPEPAR